MATIDELNSLHPKIRAIANEAYLESVSATPKNVHPIITQGYRTFEESDKLYAQGRTTPGEIVSNAKAGSSFHNYALALDFALIVDGKTIWDENSPYWGVVVNIFKKHGFEWGGNWKSIKDYPHLQMTFGYTWKQLLAKHNAGDFIPGTTYVNI